MEKAKEEINALKKTIEINRDKLNRMISENEGNVYNKEILKLSRELDELLVKYQSYNGL
ncbi:MAG: aspartyl-phosphate phosphatase Spo0E family protein [Tissierellia bacterium]|nr:aspartyl-phosphate phosphatase Spo0E family protein [Tissierellia bacterium]